jgi:hypothetical protein
MLHNVYCHCASQRAAPAVSSGAAAHSAAVAEHTGNGADSGDEQEEERQHFAEIGDPTPRELRYFIAQSGLIRRSNAE